MKRKEYILIVKYNFQRKP